ncbi:hypothetical protein GCM10009751_28360 [Myceligenerans crystallogenes]|uniref:Uncharacterized protein n=1 Tax=Myceligenerans crystallogenes TaxID=316335 RepID=A0ABP4ZQQ2_9MICO
MDAVGYVVTRGVLVPAQGVGLVAEVLGDDGIHQSVLHPPARRRAPARRTAARRPARGTAGRGVADQRAGTVSVVRDAASSATADVPGPARLGIIEASWGFQVS